MAPPRAAVGKPRAGIPRNKPIINRLAGSDLKSKSGLTTFRPSPARSTTPSASVPSTRRMQCPTSPDHTDFEMNDETGVYCRECGAQVSETHQLVSEQTFAEGPGGQIMAQGVAISAGETHRRTAGFAATGKAGSEAVASSKTANRNAAAVITSLITQLGIAQEIGTQALRLFSLTYARGFVRGRSLNDVALVCLYLVSRQATTQTAGIKRPRYSFMLIDFAEHGEIDVFALGKIYTDLIRDMFLYQGRGKDDIPRYNILAANTDEERLPLLLAPGPEVFVPRFVEELEFPPGVAEKIKADAYKIVASMKRDWITRGRRPAGVCGAAVIIAARMNNYRRTVREVVLVAKVTEITLNKRLEEFSQTPLSKSSVNEFRKEKLPNVDVEDLKEVTANGQKWDPNTETEEVFMARVHEERENQRRAQYPHLPDALNPPIMMPKTKKRRRKGQGDTAAELEDDDSEQPDDTEENGKDYEQRPTKQARVDAQGFAIPAQPASSGLANKSGTAKKKVGRPKGSKNWRAPAASAEERALEEELQHDIDENMPELEATANRIAADERANSEQPQAVESGADTLVNTSDDAGEISMSPTLKAYEFEDDPDVSTCVLNNDERILKEMLWVNENAEWLRQDHAKRIRRQLKDAELREKGIDPAQFERNKRAQGRRRKDGSRMPGRHGDVAYLDNPEYDRRAGPHATPGAGDRASVDSRAGSASPAPGGGDRLRSAAESVTRMLRQRTPFSTRLNYAAIGNIYGSPSEMATRSPTPASPSRASSAVSEAPSDRSRSRSYSVAGTTSSRTQQTQDKIAITNTQKRERMRAGLSEDTDRSEFIFGGYGGKNTGLQRSKASLSAEKRQLQNRAARDGSAGPSGAGRDRDGSQGTNGGDSAQGTPEAQRSISLSASPTPQRASKAQQAPSPAATKKPTRATQQQRSVTFAKSPPQGTPSGGNTPRSAHSSQLEGFAGTEEVVEGEAVEGEEEGFGEIRELAPPGGFEGEDDEEDDGDEEDDEDEDEDDEGAGEVDIDDAFAGRLRSRY